MADSEPAAPRPIRWSHVLLAVGVAFAVAEIASRIAIRVAVGEPFRSFDAYTFSGYGVYRQNPAYTHPAFHHNAAGFRNTREFSVEKPANTLRIMAIGASVLYSGAAPGAGDKTRRVSTEETITAHLEADLAASTLLEGFDLEVINASVNRHRHRNLIPYWIAELSRYRPDIVLVFGTANDLRPYEIEAAVFDPSDPLPEEARIDQLANQATFGALFEKGVRVAINRSAVAALAYRVTERALARVSAPMARARNTRQRKQPKRPRAVVPTEELGKNAQAYLASLGALTTHIDLMGARQLVFWEYHLLAIADQKPLSDDEVSLRDFLVRRTGGYSDEEVRVRFAFRDEVADFLRARKVPFVDLLPEMRRNPDTLYADYLHYDAEGNRWVAARLATRLEPMIEDWVRAQREASVAAARL